MTKTFESLDDHKQQRILNAALQEFAEYGYEQASTNRIVKSAGIGKGMLFYYFKNKKELYLYLLDYSLHVINAEFLSQVDTNEPDFLERLKKTARLKMKYLNEQPHVNNFLGTHFLSNEQHIPADLDKRLEEMKTSAYSRIYDNIDKTLFRKDINVEKAFNLIRWSIEGYQNELMQRLKGQKMSSIDMDPLEEEFHDYIEILKTTYYSDEEEQK